MKNDTQIEAIPRTPEETVGWLETALPKSVMEGLQSYIEEAKKKLNKLSGNKHNIYSSAAAYYKNKLIWKTTQKTIVKIRSLNRKEINGIL